MKRFFLSGLVASTVLFAACSSDDDNVTPNPTDDDPGTTPSLYNEDGTWTQATLDAFMENTTFDEDATGADESVFDWTVAKGGTSLDIDIDGATVLTSITEDTTLDQPKYEIQGAVFVRSGATLTIPAGTKFYANPDNDAAAEGANSADVLIVEQGARLVAEGTADNPIVFTSTTEEVGSWGGIVMLGRAPINLDGGTGISEVSDNAGEDLIFGGNDAADDSGSLKYVILAYPGTQINTDSEYNGFSFYGLGTGTVLENLEVYMGQDDGFEWFGGTVNATNLYSNAYDDSFDWTDGWVGTITNIVADQPEDGGDFCIEADNQEEGLNASPRSNPTVQDATFYSSGQATAGILLRRGTSVTMDNAVFVINNSNEIPNIRIDDEVTAQLFVDGDLSLTNIKLDSDNPEFGGNSNK